MGYGVLGKGFNAKSDPWYFCRVCKEWNSPFEAKTPEEFERMKKDNLCRRCFDKANIKSFFDKEETG
jgi:hypothetical protein